MSAPTRRLFIGLLPHDDVRDAILDHQQRWCWGAGGLPTRATRLHLTLHFVGEMDTTREQALRRALAGEAVARFALVLRTHERWAGGRRAARRVTRRRKAAGIACGAWFVCDFALVWSRPLARPRLTTCLIGTAGYGPA